ncbi:Gustatory receptor for sugar taste 64f [Orchesella cincta]|uniref:Gustatory receptor for sugar taste 64f n=1 Tax=Orchesella cincta TaxID=48709 RepID=A0A1D2MA17_ORCCI|nr:Gustatory receptor for sugar taste 64f [Orchesella cincta]
MQASRDKLISSSNSLKNSNEKIFAPLSTPATEDKFQHANQGEENDIFSTFRGLLILGRILGVIPFSGVFKKSYKDLYFSRCSVAAIANVFCVTLLVFNTTVAIGNAVRDRKRNALEIAWSIGTPLFSMWGLFIYSYFMIRGDEFLKILKFWASCNIHYSKKDIYLYRTVVITSIVLFTSAVLENAVLHMEFFEVFDDINGHIVKYGKETGNASVIKMYYWRGHTYWNGVVGYHPIFAVIAFLVHKWVLYGWNYIDVLMALICRALYFKFKVLCRAAEDTLFLPLPLESPDVYIPSEFDRQAWRQLTKDHDQLCNLIDVMNRFFSPLIFVSYSVNIYFVCMQLLGTLNPDVVAHSIVHSIYAPWSFVHIIARIFVLSICAAKINEYAHNIRNVVQRCPVELYEGSVAKLDKRVNTGPKLGLSGLGCFVVTKPFMLSILNVVFTIEIVLLQGLSTSQSKRRLGGF